MIVKNFVRIDEGDWAHIDLFDLFEIDEMDENLFVINARYKNLNQSSIVEAFETKQEAVDYLKQMMLKLEENYGRKI